MSSEIDDEYHPDHLQDIGQIAIQTAIPPGEVCRGPNGVSRVGRSLILNDLIIQTNEARNG